MSFHDIDHQYAECPSPQRRVSASTVRKTINRPLADQYLEVRRSRSEAARLELSDYYLLNWRLNGIDEKHVDLEELARGCGALRHDETIIDE